MIRTALFADVDAVITVIASAYSDYIPLLGRNPQPLDDDYDALIAGGDVHLLEEASAIVGVLVTQSTDDGLLIRTVGILPGVQGKGLGTKLMVFAERLADDQDVRMLRPYTNEVMTGTVRLYARLGYAETHRKGPEGRQVIYIGDRSWPDALAGYHRHRSGNLLWKASHRGDQTLYRSSARHDRTRTFVRCHHRGLSRIESSATGSDARFRARSCRRETERPQR